MQTRGVRALLAAVIVMGVMILLGTAVLIGTVVRRAMRPATGVAAAAPMFPADGTMRQLTLDQPPGTHIASVLRQSDTVLAVLLSGGGRADRLLLWDVAAGRLVGSLALDRAGGR